jgi:4-hydroxy-tetrahydrodipicolinate reductase
MSDTPIPVLVNGATGKMGREVIKVVAQAADMQLVGAVARSFVGHDIGDVVGIGSTGVLISDDLQGSLLELTKQPHQPGVMVDFTHPSVVYENMRAAIAFGIPPVVGTTGLSDAQVLGLTAFADKASIGALIAPNFAIGMVLMQQMAAQAARYFDHVEIIELHHNQKADAPSGTALQTAAQLAAGLDKALNVGQVDEKEILRGARGGVTSDNIHIHSIRLPGLVAHQQVIFGGLGQTLTLQHDAFDRVAYMPGVLLGIRRVRQLDTVVFGLDQILS